MFTVVNKKHIIIGILAGLMCLLPAGASLAQQGAAGIVVPEGPGRMLEASLGKAMSAGHYDGIRFADGRAMQVFYSERGYQLFWLGDGGLNKKAHALISVLQESWTHGLNPEKYHLAAIEKHLGRGMVKNNATLEIMLTDAAVRYARDLSGMRIDPATIKQEREFWKQPEEAGVILASLAGSGDIAGTLEAFAPQDKLYQSLRAELIRLGSSPEMDFSHILPLEFGKAFLFPGERSRNVPKLRVRLGLPPSDNHLYDDDLAQAVVAFQRSNNLEPDGIIGPKTLDLLNQSNQKKMLQIIANLERLRWLDRELPKRYILVNTASQMLWAVENGKVELEMKVINGKPARRTKEFKTEITGIRFNPDWTVPPGIKRYDIWPKVKENPGYLHEKGIEVIKGRGKEAIRLDPHSIDWNRISPKELQELRLIGYPGKTNPLGYVRVLMPNKFDMYLHDTNHPELFEKQDRTQSSGCIRIERPHDIAQFVLKHNKDWEKKMIGEIIATGKTTEVKAEAKMPVYIIHQTAWLDSRGGIVFGADIYKRDKDLIDVLKNINGYVLPIPEFAAAIAKPKTVASKSLIP